MKIFKQSIATLLLSMFCLSSTLAEVVVVVHSSININSISKSDLGRIFLGKSDQLPDGTKVKPLNQIFASPIRTEFDRNLLGKSEGQMKNYWSRQMFSGEGTPPEEVNGDLDVLAKIAADPTVIGYIDNSAANDSLKVLSIK